MPCDMRPAPRLRGRLFLFDMLLDTEVFAQRHECSQAIGSEIDKP